MIELFPGRVLDLAFDPVLAGYRRVPLVKALCCDLAGMVYTHEPGGVLSFGVREAGLIDVFRRVRTGRRAGRCGDRTKEVACP